MSFYDLFFLAAGGVIGSGWLVGAAQADQRAGPWAVLSWLIGGALMLVIATVMVKLSTAVPKTGGLIFLPLQSSGPLLAIVVAAGLWVFYAANPASEAAAMVRGLVTWRKWQNMVIINSQYEPTGLASRGIAWAAVFILLITSVNLLGPRRFLLVNNVLTTFKILVPLLIIALLLYAKVHLHAVSFQGCPPSNVAPAGPYNFGSVLSAVTAGSIIYAYLGFQGPLDTAGNVRRRGIGEAARLRRAIYATVCGSIFLYVSLQFVVIYIRQNHGAICGTESLYTEFARAVAHGWPGSLASGLINLDTVLSPVGTGMILTYVLTREVAALSRAHLTHRGLQKSRYSVIPLAGRRLRKLFGDDRLDVYWLILIVDFFVSGISLLCFGRNFRVLNAITSIMALIIYATPGVVLTSLRHRDPGRFPGRWYSILAGVGFVSIAVIFFLAGWDLLWPGMAALTVSCLLLFGLPLLVPASRWYDAKAHAAQFRQLRTIRQLRANPAAASAALLFGFFAMLTLASRPFRNNEPTHLPGNVCRAVSLVVLVAVLAVIVFRLLVKLSRRYMKEHPPTLPTLAPAPKSAGSVPPPQTATGQSG